MDDMIRDVAAAIKAEFAFREGRFLPLETAEAMARRAIEAMHRMGWGPDDVPGIGVRG